MPEHAKALEVALATRGLPWSVEARDTLAVLLPTGRYVPLDAVARRHLIELARQHGFTHAAVEIPSAGAAWCDSSLV
ncbi:MAG: hypothetical protein IT361_13360 [Gemmatimonadaceae bacterium]|nr:hypothetical protein [Gemmatimonadaceae bacterium]